MGNKVLRQRLKGPSLAAYYPRRLVTMEDLQKRFVRFHLELDNEKQEDRLEHLAGYVGLIKLGNRSNMGVASNRVGKVLQRRRKALLVRCMSGTASDRDTNHTNQTRKPRGDKGLSSTSVSMYKYTVITSLPFAGHLVLEIL
jgi:hypothetical protein